MLEKILKQKGYNVLLKDSSPLPNSIQVFLTKVQYSPESKNFIASYVLVYYTAEVEKIKKLINDLETQIVLFDIVEINLGKDFSEIYLNTTV